MTVPASAIRKMVQLGLAAGDIADLCEIIEADTTPPKSAKSEANARYYRSRKLKRATESVTENALIKTTESRLKMTENALIQSPLACVRDKTPKLVITGKNLSEDKSSSRRATKRCPPEFQPSAALLDWAASEAMPPGFVERELAKMKDHEFRSPKSDWDATFRNWARTAAENARPHKINGTSPREDRLQRMFNGAVAATRESSDGR